MLNERWELSARTPGASLTDELGRAEGWLSAAVPGTVHEALLGAGRIPDPFYGENERTLQWIGEGDWIYRCRFTPPRGLAEAPRVVLRCDGLDTFATVILNGQEVLRSDNMFLPAEADVGARLREGENELAILFESAARRAKEREAAGGAMRVWNGDASRVYARKAQYHWGWDWGPCLITAGPYRAVRLLAFTARIAGLHCRTVLDGPGGAAEVCVRLFAEGPAEAAALRLTDPDGAVVAEAEVPLAGGAAACALPVAAPRPWWPAGLGPQPLYRLEVALRGGGATLDQRTLRLGLRRLDLVQEPLVGRSGRSFHFAVNGRPFFAGGANWIPADSFPPRVDAARYRRLLTLARDAGVTMLRIWGGGIYEEDLFYDLCDELGLLVWQDFMFACGLYPAEEWFVASVRAEAAAQIERLRHHACLALWCGNNEDYSIATSLKAFPPQQRAEAAPPFPARLLYEDVLAEICAALDPDRPYWPGSPYSGSPDLDPNAPHVGDRHSWDVWHGPMADYQDYGRFAGRFVSEFGMQALPALPTLLRVLPEGERTPDSPALRWHNKADGGPERLASYISRNLPLPRDLAGQVYTSQLMQAEALGWALRSFRRRFGGPGQRRTGGALVWQWNDCWPAISWAIVDYDLVPKASYYVVRRELAPLVLGLAPTPSGAALWAVNGTDAEVDAELELRALSLDGRLLAREGRPLRLPANQATELAPWTPPAAPPAVYGARLLVAGRPVARAVLWPEPLRDLPLADPGVTLEADGARLRLRAARPAKGVWLEAEGATFSDNAVDLLPDEEITIEAAGLGGRLPRLRWLGA